MAAVHRSHILVYNGRGSCKESRKLLVQGLKMAVDLSHHLIRYVSPRQILEGSWMENTCLIIFGGGYDRGFESAVGQQGVKLIRQFVLKGGSYLGICAGGYWACDYIEFDKKGPLEVTGERFLKFYPGMGIGPTFPGFHYDSRAGVRAVPITYQGCTTFDAYFDGGGFFQPYQDHNISSVGKSAVKRLKANSPEICTESKPHSTCAKHDHDIVTSKSSLMDTLGAYVSLEKDSVVKCQVGNGVAILSGVHLEFPAHLLDKEDNYMKKCLPELLRSEDTRRLVFKDILSQLRVKCQGQGHSKL